MVKHILGIGLYQTIVIFTIIFAGDRFIYEGTKKHSLYGWVPTRSEAEDIVKACKEYNVEDILNDPANELPGAQFIKEDRVFTGRKYDWNSEPLYKCYYDVLGPSRHLSVVFCTFVYL